MSTLTADDLALARRLGGLPAVKPAADDSPEELIEFATRYKAEIAALLTEVAKVGELNKTKATSLFSYPGCPRTHKQRGIRLDVAWNHLIRTGRLVQAYPDSQVAYDRAQYRLGDLTGLIVPEEKFTVVNFQDRPPLQWDENPNWSEEDKAASERLEKLLNILLSRQQTITEGYIAIGLALREIRDNKLWRICNLSAEAFWEAIGYGKESNVSQYISAAEYATKQIEQGKPPPTSKTAARKAIKEKRDAKKRAMGIRDVGNSPVVNSPAKKTKPAVSQEAGAQSNPVEPSEPDVDPSGTDPVEPQEIVATPATGEFAAIEVVIRVKNYDDKYTVRGFNYFDRHEELTEKIAALLDEARGLPEQLPGYDPNCRVIFTKANCPLETLQKLLPLLLPEKDFPLIEKTLIVT